MADFTARANINNASSASFTVTNVIEEKAGRVIGSKRISDLKAGVGAFIDQWASEVNGSAEDKAAEVEEADPDAELKARLAELG